MAPLKRREWPDSGPSSFSLVALICRGESARTEPTRRGDTAR